MDETRFDKIEIKELEIFANHGVYPEENVLGQKFVISATLFTHTRQAGLTDDLSASINYGEVSHMITDFTRKHTFGSTCRKSCRDAARLSFRSGTDHTEN